MSQFQEVRGVAPLHRDRRVHSDRIDLCFDAPDRGEPVDSDEPRTGRQLLDTGDCDRAARCTIGNVTTSASRSAFDLGMAVHGFLAARMGGTLETQAEASDDGSVTLIAGDLDFLHEAIAACGPVLRDAGHGHLVDQARALAEDTVDLPAIAAADLIEDLMVLAGVDPATLLPLAAPPADGGT